MNKYRLTILIMTAFAFTACSQSGNEPTADTVEDAASADDGMAPAWDIAGIESVEIVPGLSKRILEEGTGAVAETGHTVVVHYTGWLFDADAENFRGNKFDSSVDRDQHFEFPLGAGRVIRGWDQGVTGMKIGETRELTIAPEMGYGERGAGALIPPGSTLVFVVQLADLRGLGMPDQLDMPTPAAPEQPTTEN
jgi:FKBP-type peptidyl-prolyl cis-trans isomerase